jgi:hypothetical protein
VRLQHLADQLEKTGTLNAEIVVQSRQIVRVMRVSPTEPDRATVAMLMDAAEVYSSHGFHKPATALSSAADILPTVERSLSRKITQLLEAADSISSSTRRIGRFKGER